MSARLVNDLSHIHENWANYARIRVEDTGYIRYVPTSIDVTEIPSTWDISSASSVSGTNTWSEYLTRSNVDEIPIASGSWNRADHNIWIETPDQFSVVFDETPVTIGEPLLAERVNFDSTDLEDLI